MTYTMKTAALSLADARHILATPSLCASESQKARAKVVVAHWARIRKAQEAKKAKKAA